MPGTVRQRTQILRIALLAILTLAALAIIGLVFEWVNVAREMSPNRLVRLVALGVANLLFTASIATLAALFLWTRISRSLPDLKGWHLERPESEFQENDADGDFSFDEYRNLEDQVFREQRVHDSMRRDRAPFGSNVEIHTNLTGVGKMQIESDGRRVA